MSPERLVRVGHRKLLEMLLVAASRIIRSGVERSISKWNAVEAAPGLSRLGALPRVPLRFNVLNPTIPAATSLGPSKSNAVQLRSSAVRRGQPLSAGSSPVPVTSAQRDTLTSVSVAALPATAVTIQVSGSAPQPDRSRLQRALFARRGSAPRSAGWCACSSSRSSLCRCSTF